MAEIRHLASGEGWAHVELSLDWQGPEGYLTLKLLELLGLQCDSNTILTLGVLTYGPQKGNFGGAEGDRQLEAEGGAQTALEI